MTPELRTCPTGAPTADPAERARTILLVEDDADLRYMARRALERLGYRVLAAGDGEQALDLFREHEQAIDLVLSDAGLPKLDGVGLYRAVRERNDRVRFLLASGSNREIAGAGGELDERIPFIQKPWTLDQLATAVGQALAS